MTISEDSDFVEEIYDENVSEEDRGDLIAGMYSFHFIYKKKNI